VKRILVAEDDPASSRLLGIILKRLGLEVVVHGDGPAVIAACARERFDLILMDMNLPGLDGLAATRTIRAGEAGGVHVPIIAITGHAFPEDRRRCLDAGMDDYLAKPLAMDLLQERVRFWLGLPDAAW
jgi:CheY-like chemotaxis protein